MEQSRRVSTAQPAAFCFLRFLCGLGGSPLIAIAPGLSLITFGRLFEDEIERMADSSPLSK
jgi:hypothetical protein